MAFEIFSAPFAHSNQGDWKLNSQCINLNENMEVFEEDFPFAQIPLLPIGARIENDLNISSNSRIKKIFSIEDFNAGKIMCLDDFEEKIFEQKYLNKKVNQTKFYVFNVNGRKLVFYCYEIFRAFLCNNNSLIRYLFQYDLWESFIEKQEIYKQENKDCLNIYFYENFPVKHTRSKSFMERLILLLYNPDIRTYWKSLQANEKDGINDFSFTTFPLKNIKLKVRIKEYKTFDLVLHIDSIPSKLNFPFDIVNVHHPKFRASPKGKSGKPKDSNNNDDDKPKTVKVKLDIPKSNEISKGDTKDSSSSNGIAVLPLSMSFNKTIVIANKRPESTNESKNKRNRILLSFKLKDIKLGFGGSDEASETQFLETERELSANKFSYDTIPPGLVPFSKSIEIISSTLKINFSYKLMEFSEESPFHVISNPNAQKRKAQLIEIQNNPAIYLCEIDSSDDKFISTLAVTNLKHSNKEEFFEKVLEMASTKNGTWPEEYLDLGCTHLTIKHPKKIKLEEGINIDSQEYNIYVDRLAKRLVNILT